MNTSDQNYTLYEPIRSQFGSNCILYELIDQNYNIKTNDFPANRTLKS